MGIFLTVSVAKTNKLLCHQLENIPSEEKLSQNSLFIHKWLFFFCLNHRYVHFVDNYKLSCLVFSLPVYKFCHNSTEKENLSSF